MNFLVAAVIVFISKSCAAIDYRHRCLLFRDGCVDHCPRMMHPYHTRCDGDTLSQRTCESPNIRVLGYTCGWSRCDCNGVLLLDEISGLCVQAPECSVELPARYRHRAEPELQRRNYRVRIPSKGIEDERVK